MGKLLIFAQRKVRSDVIDLPLRKGCQVCEAPARPCIYCGKPICEDCGVYTLDGVHCADCYELEAMR